MGARGKFVVIDGIDGVGKGVFLDTLVEEAKKSGKRVLDVNRFWKGFNKHPHLSKMLGHFGIKVPKWEYKPDYHPNIEKIIGNYDVIVTSEETFVGIGCYIREEMTAKNHRKYSPEVTAEAYALDRHILYQQLILPAREAGIDVYQSRSFSTSIVYQRQSALDEGREFEVEKILAIPGNAFCIQHPMDYLLVPTINNVGEAIRRAQSRDKQDDCIFENLEFQLKLKANYESAEFRAVFEKIGVPVIYMDAGKTIEHSEKQAREFYQKHLAKP